MAATLAVASAHPPPRLVLWPEDVVALDRPLAGSPQAALLSRLARELRTTLLVGVTEPASATSFRNEVVAWGPGGHIVGVFEKVHRVPFGEYVPCAPSSRTSPTSRACPPTPLPVAGPASCARRPGPSDCWCRSRSSTPAGATSRCGPEPSCRRATNTSSYTTSQVPAQEMAAAAVQAVETGRDLVQAAPTGFSAVVTPRGVVVQRSALGLRQVLFATVALRRGMTPYDHWVDLPVLFGSALALVAGWVRQLRYSSSPTGGFLTCALPSNMVLHLLHYH